MSDDKAKEWERLAAMIAEARRHDEIAKAQRMFEPIYRSLRLGDQNSTSTSKPMPKRRRRRPSVEEVAIAQGIIKVRSSLEEQK